MEHPFPFNAAHDDAAATDQAHSTLTWSPPVGRGFAVKPNAPSAKAAPPTLPQDG